MAQEHEKRDDRDEEQTEPQFLVLPQRPHALRTFIRREGEPAEPEDEEQEDHHLTAKSRAGSECAADR